MAMSATSSCQSRVGTRSKGVSSGSAAASVGTASSIALIESGRGASFDLFDRRAGRAAPATSDVLDLRVEHLFLLDFEFAADGEVVKGARPPRRHDVEAGQVAATRTAIAHGRISRLLARRARPPRLQTTRDDSVDGRPG